jgi:amino acid transporter/mannitol/fructose-specific phosphotransferase system IIA component (Ntr-type)
LISIWPRISKKELGLLDVFCLASGAMISSGLFILPGMAHARAGPAVIASYFLAALFALTGLLSQAELVSAMPKAGGTYFYVKRTMGPAMGAVDGLVTWFSLTLKSAFALVGMAAFTAYVIDLDVRLIAMAFCAVFVALNLFGIKEAAKVQVVLVTGLFAALAFFVVRGVPSVTVENLAPFSPHGFGAVLSTAGFVFISYGGLLKVASVAEEVKDPGRVVPLGMILSLLVVGLLYIAVVFVTSGVMDDRLLNISITPISDAAAVFLGGRGRIVLGIAAIFAFISTANAGIMAASRYPLALSRDKLLPGILGRINERFKTPHFSILVTGIVMSVFLFLELGMLVKAASAVMILTYSFSCLSIIILRESRLQNYQPVFKSPLYPWMQIAGIAGSIFLLIGMGKMALMTAASALLFGFIVYWIYGRIRSGREFALLHIIERITAKELTTRSLESELKEIIRERDDIVKDRFDHLIEKAIVMDVAGPLKTDEFFALVADEMADRLGVEKAIMMKLLHDREKDSSTVLTPCLAIPHIVVAGAERFEILLARCREGVEFSESAPNIRAIFVLAGSRDERNFHLRALAGLAQIVQDLNFDEKWARAKDIEDLRDLILLGKRRRHTT